MLFFVASLVYGCCTERLRFQPFLVLAMLAIGYSYILALFFNRAIGPEPLNGAAVYFGIGIILFFIGHIAAARFGRDRITA